MNKKEYLLKRIYDIISSREKFSLEDINDFKLAKKDIIFELSKERVSVQKFKESIDLLYFIQRIRINCNTFQKELFKALKSKLPDTNNYIMPQFCHVGENEKIINEYKGDTLVNYILDNKKTYIDDLAIFLKDSNVVPKTILPFITKDLIYTAYVESVLSIFFDFSEALRWSGKVGNYRIEDLFVELVNDYRCNKILNDCRLDVLLEKISEAVLVKNGFIQKSDSLMLINIIMDVSWELFEFNTKLENLTALDRFKEQIIEVIAK